MKLLTKYVLTTLVVAVYILLALGSETTEESTKKEVIIPYTWPTFQKSESEIRDYYNKNKDSLDPIEGIYSYRGTHSVNGYTTEEIGTYRLAIVKREKFLYTEDDTYEFLVIILESDNKHWTKGRLKALFRRTAYENLYECKWFMGDYSPTKWDFKIENNGFVYSKRETVDHNSYGIPFNVIDETGLLRIYPIFDATKNIKVKDGVKSDKTLLGTGSGFLISSTGLVVTNYHVVVDGSKLDVVFPIKGITKKAKIKMKDVQNDIAILEIENFSLAEISNIDIPYTFADNSSVKVGQEVFTLGFPLGDIMGSTPRLASGNINSLYGLEDDPRLYQINNAIQPGNSGGALFNKKGELVGICVSGLNAKFFYENQGIIPQNMNFAIKASYLKNLIGMMPEGDEILKRINTVKQGALEEQIEQLNPFIVQIRVY